MNTIKLHIGIISIIIGFLFSPLLFLGVAMLIWYGLVDLKPYLLRIHEGNIANETLRFGECDFPISQLSLSTPRFHLLQYAIPQIRQLATWRDNNTGTITQIMLTTNAIGKMTAYPVSVLSAT